MSYTRAHLELARHHVEEGERHIVEQERLLSALRARGEPTDVAERLLSEFYDLLRQHREHRDQIEAELAAQTQALASKHSSLPN